MKKLLVIMLFFTGAMTVKAQNLSQMSETNRNKKLIQIAKEAVQKYAPDYYKYTNGKYTIEFIDSNSSNEKVRPFYDLKFIEYNRDEEYFRDGYAVGVSIYDDNYNPYFVWHGNGLGTIIPEKPLTRGEKPRILEYKRREPPKPVQRPDGKMMYEM